MARANEIRNRKQLTDAVADWMHENCKSWSIDTLLTYPTHAIKMARAVCAQLGMPANETNLHEVCRAALSSRKRGDLKKDKH